MYILITLPGAYEDVYVRTNYEAAANAVTYMTHRALTNQEQNLVEALLFTVLAPQFVEDAWVTIEYQGMDRSIINHKTPLSHNELPPTPKKNTSTRPKVVPAWIQQLNHQASLWDITADIGVVIIEIKDHVKNGHITQARGLYGHLITLVRTYNAHPDSSRNIEITNLLPEDIRKKIAPKTPFT